MDIDDAAARENLVKLITLQLVIARAATDDHGFNVQVIQGVGNAVEKHPVVGDDLVGFVELTAALLRVAAAQIARWQHGLHTRMPQHGLGGQTHLAEQALRTAAREIKHRLRIHRGVLRVANDRHIVFVFNIQQSARGALGQTRGHFFVDEMNHLLFQRRDTQTGGWQIGLLACQQFEDAIAQALRFEAQVRQGMTKTYRPRAGCANEPSLKLGGRSPAFLAHFAQQVAHVHAHITKVNVDWAWR